mgnify:CR=1 FL=1
MTLCVRISTPNGLVFCSDSLRTGLKKTFYLKEPKWKKSPDDRDKIIINKNLIEERPKIERLTPYIKKIFQIGKLPLGITMAGTSTFTHVQIVDGHFEDQTVPFSFLSPIIDEIITNQFGTEIEDMATLQEFLTLFIGSWYYASFFDKDVKVDLKLLCGGYSKTADFPQVFDINLSFDATDPGLRHRIVRRIANELGQLFTINLLKDLNIAEMPNIDLPKKFVSYCKNQLLSDFKNLFFPYFCFWANRHEKYQQDQFDAMLKDAQIVLKSYIYLFASIVSEYGNPLRIRNLRFQDVIHQLWEFRKFQEDDEALEDYLRHSAISELSLLPKEINKALKSVNLNDFTREWEDKWNAKNLDDAEKLKIIDDELDKVNQAFKKVIKFINKILDDKELPKLERYALANIIHLNMYFISRPIFANLMTLYQDDAPPEIKFGLQAAGITTFVERLLPEGPIYKQMQGKIEDFLSSVLKILDKHNEIIRNELQKIFSNLDEFPELKNALNTILDEMKKNLLGPIFGQSKIDYNTLPIDQAVELAKFLVDSTIKHQIYTSEVPTVGGDIKTYVLTPKTFFKEV